MAILGPDELWHLSPRDMAAGAPGVVTCCGLELLGDFPARADGDVRGHMCPDCQSDDAAVTAVPVSVLEASAAVVELYVRRGETGDPELDSALAALADQMEHPVAIAEDPPGATRSSGGRSPAAG